MGNLKELVYYGLALLGPRAGVILSGSACLAGTVLLFRRVSSRRKAKKLILQAQKRREESFRVAERVLLEYKQSVSK